METCHTCGAGRQRVGVLYPVRRLCACEQRTCTECGAPAMVVEFQAPVHGDEPPLPQESNGVAVFACRAHGPAELAAELRERRPKAASRRRSSSKPHVDPQWENAYPDHLPPGACSRQQVECSSCKNVHELRERRMHNGTRSICPKCGEAMFTDAEI
jgi:hypothetical protein